MSFMLFYLFPGNIISTVQQISSNNYLEDVSLSVRWFLAVTSCKFLQTLYVVLFMII